MGISFDSKKQNLGSRKSSFLMKKVVVREAEWEERKLRRRLSKKRISGVPVLTSCVFWWSLGPSTPTILYSVQQLRWKEGYVCLLATISSPICLSDRKMFPSDSMSPFHFYLYLTPDVPIYSSLKLLFGQALDL